MKTKREAGFGLAEVFLASGILILVMASVFALSRYVIKGSALTTSRIQASYLAQEGMERVRALRDSWWIDGVPETSFSNLINGNHQVEWQASTNSWQLLPNTGTETIDDIGPTSFQRTITVYQVSGVNSRLDSEMKYVRSTVSWQEGGRTWIVQTDTYLTNWKSES